MANEQIMFYIIVPIFNVERYLRKCLDSLLSQSYTQWKAILVNDGSTDSSGEIAQEYANKDGRFVTLNQENQGLSMARNAGLEYVKNLIISTNPPQQYLNYIRFVDSDDYLQSYALEHSYHILTQYEVDVLIYSILIAREPTTYTQVEFDWQVFPSHIKGLYTPTDLILSLGGYAMIASAGSFTGKASLIFENNITFIPHIIYEDIAFCTKSVSKCKNIYISHEQVYNYTLVPSSIMNSFVTRDKRIKITYSYFMILQTFLHSFREEENPVMKEYYYRACLDNVKKLMQSLQLVGYVEELGFNKKDLLLSLSQLNIKGKRYFCCLFPRIYGFPKRIRLALRRWILSLS